MVKMNYAKIMQSPNEIKKNFRLDRPNRCEIFANRLGRFVRLKLINLLNYRPRWKPKLELTSR